MANELNLSYNGDLNVYAVIRRKSDGAVYDATSFVTWDDANISSYAISMTSSGGDLYLGDLPSGIPLNDTYIAHYYEYSGSPSTSDILLDTEEFYWNGEKITSDPPTSNWEGIMTIIVRNLINDTTSASFTDSRIWTAITIGGLMASQEFPFANDYIFDLQTPNITPDPTLVASYDPLAVALFTLKAACILSTNQYNTALGRGIIVQDGDQRVDTTQSIRGYVDLLKMGPCGAYTTMIHQARINGGFGRGKAIMSPVALGQFYYGRTWNTRGFFDSLYW